MGWLRTLLVCPRPVAGRRDTGQGHAESASDGPHGRHVNPRIEGTTLTRSRALQLMLVLVDSRIPWTGSLGNVVGSRGSQRTGYVGRRMEGLGPILEEASPDGLTVEGSRIRQWAEAAGHHVVVTC